MAGSRLIKVLIDGGSGLNILFAKTLKKMGLNVTDMLTKRNLSFYGITPGNTAVPRDKSCCLSPWDQRQLSYRVHQVRGG